MCLNHPEKINVLCIIKPAREAGADMVLVQVASRLNRERFRVFCGLLTPDQGKVIPPELETVNFNLPRLNGLIWLRFLLHLCWVLHRQRIHIIHVNSYVPGNYARLAAILMGVPVIIDHWHGFGKFNFKRRLICRFLGRFTTHSLAVSQGVRDYVVEQCRLDPANFRVVYNAIDWSRFQRERNLRLRQELGAPPDLPLVGLVARLDHWGKGHREFLAAMAVLRKRHPCLGLIIGGGRRQAEMEQMARNLGLAKAVVFLGHRDDIPDLLAALDIFVLPSHREGVSLALLEAMAAGLPVIATKVGGLPEVVIHEKTGLLVPAADAEALAQALGRLLEDPSYAKNLGQNARQHVQTYFSIERLGRDINEIYDELVGRKFF